MSEEKQIEEMASDLENHTCMSQFQAEIASRTLYLLGYRKQRGGEWSYCPRCGAKMKERIEHEQERNAPGE